VTQPTVALYVSGHGFGHAVRSSLVAEALLRRGARVVLRTDAPAWLFPRQAEHVPGLPVDVGVVQRGGLDLDIDATREHWTSFAACLEARAEREAAMLRHTGAQVVLADVPPLAFLAAAGAGLPAFGVTNFGWDWIYAAWPGFESIVERIQAAYARAYCLLRLPLSSHAPDAFAAFPRIQDVPPIARRATRRPQEVRHELGLPADRQVVLLSFGGFHASGLDLDALAEWRQYLFLVTGPTASRAANVRQLPGQQVEYASLLAACDAVVTKPGYGIVADCLANQVPVVYTDRGPFREYEVLARALESLGQARYAPQADVLAGRLGPHLDALRAVTTPWAWAGQPLDGADRVADIALAGFWHT
jgi:L-arabinokinase